MRVLVDTNALIWWLLDDPTLSGPARTAIHEAEQAFVSAVSIWEIGIKNNRGRLDVPDDLESRLEQVGFVELPIAWRHARVAGRLQGHHSDPIDRMLVAQATADDLVIVTRDRDIARYDVRVIEA